MDNNGQPIIGVGAIVLHPDGAVLLGYRDKHGESPCWCLLGALPSPLFAANQAVLSYWLGDESPSGWETYPIAQSE
ncbi:MAG: hypothetical protein CME80_09905 [Halomonas sp.]|nr:hypothetical protein [Halomonas sp.]MBF58017.1 hypothetical protein [Halomonas sp.]